MSPKIWFFTPVSFSCAPAHLVLANRGRPSAFRSLALTPKSYTYCAPAHLVSPRN